MACAFASFAAAAAPISPNGDADVAAAIADLHSRKPEIRGHAADQLIKTGPDAIPEILRHVADRGMRVPLLRVIADMGPKGVARLLELLNDPLQAVAAAEALSLVARPDSSAQVPALLACLNVHPALRDSCGRALVRVCDLRAARQLPALRAELQKPEKPEALVRTYVLLAVAQIGSKAAPALADVLAAAGDPAPMVRRAAVRGLGAIGKRTPEVRAALETAAADSDGEVSGAAKEALSVYPPRRASKSRPGAEFK
ncbi:MAG: HEAT repeat domain-containing protein [Elusimicrobiota bacterium]